MNALGAINAGTGSLAGAIAGTQHAPGATFGGPPRPVEQTNYAQGSLLHPGLAQVISQFAAVRAQAAQAVNRAALLNAVDRFNRGGGVDRAPQFTFGEPFYAGAPEDWGKFPDAGWYAADKIPTPIVTPHPMDEFAPQVVPSEPTGVSTPRGPQPGLHDQLLALARLRSQRSALA